MTRRERVIIYSILALLVTGLGLLCVFVYRNGFEFITHSANATCVTLNYTFTSRFCDEIYGGCLRMLLGVRYDNYTGFLSVWDGSSANEARSWAKTHYPIGGNFSCVYDTANPSIVRLEKPDTVVWFIFAIITFCIVACGAGVCLAGELHHANPEGLCQRTNGQPDIQPDVQPEPQANIQSGDSKGAYQAIDSVG